MFTHMCIHRLMINFTVQVLLSERDFGQSRWPKAGVPVRGRAQRHRRNRLFGRMNRRDETMTATFGFGA